MFYKHVLNIYIYCKIRFLFCQDKKIHFLKVDKSYESDKIKHRCKKSILSMKFEGIVVTD